MRDHVSIFTANGIIGRSGRFYPCRITEHIATIIANAGDGPFVECKRGNAVMFDAHYTEPPKAIPTPAQFETVMDWCAAMGEKFEDATDCWNEPWSQWREIR